MTAFCKAACQTLLKRAGLYERVKGSWLYDAYWSIADRRLIEQRKEELDFFRKTLVGFRKNDLIFDIGANQGLKTGIFVELGARVIAVDPDVSNQKTLTERFLALRLRKRLIIVVPKAVSDRSGHEIFWVSKPGFEMNTLNARWAETLGKESREIRAHLRVSGKKRGRNDHIGAIDLNIWPALLYQDRCGGLRAQRSEGDSKPACPISRSK